MDVRIAVDRIGAADHADAGDGHIVGQGRTAVVDAGVQDQAVHARIDFALGAGDGGGVPPQRLHALVGADAGVGAALAARRLFLNVERTGHGGRGDAGQQGGGQGDAAHADEIPGCHVPFLSGAPAIKRGGGVSGERRCRSAFDQKALHAWPLSAPIRAKLCHQSCTRSHPREVPLRQEAAAESQTYAAESARTSVPPDFLARPCRPKIALCIRDIKTICIAPRLQD